MNNNISGMKLEKKYQFATFEESSYEGNPLLRGPHKINGIRSVGYKDPNLRQDMTL